MKANNSIKSNSVIYIFIVDGIRTAVDFCLKTKIAEVRNGKHKERYTTTEYPSWNEAEMILNKFINTPNDRLQDH